MPFDYYHRLNRRDQAIYRRSDAVVRLEIPDAAQLAALVPAIEQGLRDDDCRATGRATRVLCEGLCRALNVPTVVLRVLKRRPSNSSSELHGLYEREEGETAIIRVWMRTAVNTQPVRLRTFLRTVLHELCHHFDYELLGLSDSFHTEGFFRRESSLAKQLLPPSPGKKKKPAAEAKPPARAGQLSLPGL